MTPATSDDIRFTTYDLREEGCATPGKSQGGGSLRQSSIVNRKSSRPPVQPTPYTLGFNAGREGYEYANPYWGNLPRWLAYDTGHQDGRKAAVALAAARGGV